MQLTAFRKELTGLGANDKERASKLGVVPKSIERYRKGDFPKVIQGLLEHPALLRALAEDAEGKGKERMPPA